MADPISKDDLPFRHYTLKHRLVSWISIRLFDNVTYTVHRGLLKGMKRKAGLGWVPALSSWASIRSFGSDCEAGNPTIDPRIKNHFSENR